MGSLAWCGKNLLVDNIELRLVDGAGFTVPWAGSVGVGMLPSNLYDNHPGTVARPVDTRVPVIICARWALPTPVPTMVALLNHNLLAGAQVQLVSAASPSGPWTVEADLSDVLATGPCIWKACTAVGGALWRGLRITDYAGSLQSMSIGELYLGQHAVLSRRPAWGFSVGRRFLRAGNETELGLSRDYYLGEHQMVEANAAARLSSAELAELTAIYDTVKGGTLPLLWIPDNTEPACFLAKLQGDEYMPRLNSTDRWDEMPVVLREVAWGRPIAW